jgi:hypothetical protein
MGSSGLAATPKLKSELAEFQSTIKLTMAEITEMFKNTLRAQIQASAGQVRGPLMARPPGDQNSVADQVTSCKNVKL